jgi:hypothetical protein
MVFTWAASSGDKNMGFSQSRQVRQENLYEILAPLAALREKSLF